jgi:hypothetical protein
VDREGDMFWRGTVKCRVLRKARDRTKWIVKTLDDEARELVLPAMSVAVLVQTCKAAMASVVDDADSPEKKAEPTLREVIVVFATAQNKSGFGKAGELPPMPYAQKFKPNLGKLLAAARRAPIAALTCKPLLETEFAASLWAEGYEIKPLKVRRRTCAAPRRRTAREKLRRVRLVRLPPRRLACALRRHAVWLLGGREEELPARLLRELYHEDLASERQGGAHDRRLREAAARGRLAHLGLEAPQARESGFR